MKRIIFLKITTIAVSMLLLFMYGIWWQQMLRNPERRTATDFISFYAVGRIAQTTGLSSIYNIEFQREAEQEVVGTSLPAERVLLFIHPPQLVPLLALLISGDYQLSLIRWVLLLIGIYLSATAYLVNILFKADDIFLKIGMLAAGLTFIPLYISIWQGQDTAFVFIGIALWCIGLLTRREWLIAGGVAFTTLRPHISIMLTLPLLLQFPKAFWRAVFLSGTATLISILLLGKAGVSDLLKLIHISAEGEWFGINTNGMLNLLGVLARFPLKLTPPTVSALGWIIFALGGMLIVMLWARSTTISESLLSLTIIIAVLTAPHLHLHDLTPLLISVLLTLRMESKALYQLPVSILVLGFSLLLLAGFITSSLYFIAPYFLCLLLVWRSQKQNKPAGSSPP